MILQNPSIHPSIHPFFLSFQHFSAHGHYGAAEGEDGQGRVRLNRFKHLVKIIYCDYSQETLSVSVTGLKLLNCFLSAKGLPTSALTFNREV